jgi:hypothetical protein
VKTYLKAAVASLIAGLSVLGASLADSDSLTAQDFISALVAALVALGAVYQTPNQP